MDIKKLIDGRNQALYNKVRASYKVNLKKSDDKCWGSYLSTGTVIISHYKTNYPISSFTHELLHIDTQLDGFKRIAAGVSLDKETHNNLNRICSCLDNEFQHHKMFDKFTGLGFASNEFYNDLDDQTSTYLKKVLGSPNQPLIYLCVDYMTLIAPGGKMSDIELAELKQAFADYDGGKYRTNFEEIDNIISDWKEDTKYDAEPYIVRFFKSINAGQTWITYDLFESISSENFPSSGFFTDGSFSLKELAKAFGK